MPEKGPLSIDKGDTEELLSGNSKRLCLLSRSYSQQCVGLSSKWLAIFLLSPPLPVQLIFSASFQPHVPSELLF